MKTYFVDTSALFKRYLPEEGSERMDSLFHEDAEVFISTLAVVELLSNLQRLRSMDKAIDDDQFAAAWAAFSLDLATGRLEALGISSEVVDGATQLLLDSYITPVDALQISAAMSLGEGAIVVSSDRKLNQLVAALGLQHMDPSQQPTSV